MPIDEHSDAPERLTWGGVLMLWLLILWAGRR